MSGYYRLFIYLVLWYKGISTYRRKEYMHGDRKAALGRDGSGNMEIEGLATELGKEKKT